MEKVKDYESRIEICKKCPHVKKEALLRCGQCGCYLKVKARLPFFDCPLQKWRREPK